MEHLFQGWRIGRAEGKRKKDGKKSRPSAFMELNSLPLSFNWPRLIDPPF